MGSKQVVEENRDEALKYLTIVLPKHERTSEQPDAPLSRKAKGSSNPPVPDKVLHVMTDSRHASYLYERVQELADAPVTISGYSFTDLYGELLASPGCSRDWPDTKRRALELFCHLIAQMVYDDYGAARIEVRLSPKDEPFLGTARQAADRDKRIDATESYRRIYAKLRALEREHPGVGREEVKRRLSEMHDLSVPQIRRAITWARREGLEAA